MRPRRALAASADQFAWQRRQQSGAQTQAGTERPRAKSQPVWASGRVIWRVAAREREREGEGGRTERERGREREREKQIHQKGRRQQGTDIQNSRAREARPPRPMPIELSALGSHASPSKETEPSLRAWAAGPRQASERTVQHAGDAGRGGGKDEEDCRDRVRSEETGIVMAGWP
ncbi:unnamed protein product [Prorocentrum cordatum]|uniref:Uncharacterized protein n=1 Tax=Prorocentrum cordatum TaxID=2364126 RepID=A0ABN9XXL8_9DINO|nr:unnamed protein product [Polarella glacialis]